MVSARAHKLYERAQIGMDKARAKGMLQGAKAGSLKLAFGRRSAVPESSRPPAVPEDASVP